MNEPDQRILIEHSLPDERLDSFLHSRFPTLSRSTLHRLIREGQITVNQAPAKPTHHPRAGEEIQIRWPAPKPSTAQPQDIPLDILHEDQDLLVLNKSPDIVVHPSAGHEDQTLVNALLHHCHGQLSGIGGVARPGIVHRLDLETSGCLLVAKNDPTHLALATLFAERRIRKVYQALVCGTLNPTSGEIQVAIARHPSHRKRMAVTRKAGRDAWTSYRLLQQFPHAALVEALLHTGRTHQVRVHFQFIGHPVVGDLTYGHRPNQRLIEATGYSAPRHLLHAHELEFVHPTTSRTLKIVAPLPPDFQAALQSLTPL